MRWVEFIKVQTARLHVAEELLSFVADCKKNNGLLEARVFKHASVNDCSLCLLWNTDRVKPQGSTLGLQLSKNLKKYGLVDHSVWVEKGQNEPEIKGEKNDD